MQNRYRIDTEDIRNENIINTKQTQKNTEQIQNRYIMKNKYIIDTEQIRNRFRINTKQIQNRYRINKQ